MKFRLLETLSLNDKRPNEMSTEEFLTSEELHKKLQKEFGDKFNYNPVCHDVSNAVVTLSNDHNVKVAPVRMVLKIDEENNLEVVSTKGHTVVSYNNKLYDYTSNQYISSGVKETSGVKVLQPFQIPENGLMPIGDENAYKYDNMILIPE